MRMIIIIQKDNLKLHNIERKVLLYVYVFSYIIYCRHITIYRFYLAHTA